MAECSKKSKAPQEPADRQEGLRLRLADHRVEIIKEIIQRGRIWKKMVIFGGQGFPRKSVTTVGRFLEARSLKMFQYF